MQSIVELHDGRVSASSAGRGMGSTFAIALPILQQERADATRPRSIPTPRACALACARALRPDAI